MSSRSSRRAGRRLAKRGTEYKCSKPITYAPTALSDRRSSGAGLGAVHTWELGNFGVLPHFARVLDAIKEDTVLLELGSPLGDWLSERKLGVNMYDYEDGAYLWSCPVFILRAMVNYYKSDAFAGMTLEEYLGAMFNAP